MTLRGVPRPLFNRPVGGETAWQEVAPLQQLWRGLRWVRLKVRRLRALGNDEVHDDWREAPGNKSDKPPNLIAGVAVGQASHQRGLPQRSGTSLLPVTAGQAFAAEMTHRCDQQKTINAPALAWCDQTRRTGTATRMQRGYCGT